MSNHSIHTGITVGDLFNEGRRFVLEVGKYHKGKGFRAIIVFENYPGYFPSGEISNRADANPIIWWETDDEKEAKAMAHQHSEKVLGLSIDEHSTITISSWVAQNKARKVQVKHDPGTGQVWLQNGYGHEMELEEDDAVALYQDLAQSMDLLFRENCKCGRVLNYENQCEECDYQ